MMCLFFMSVKFYLPSSCKNHTQTNTYFISHNTCVLLKLSTLTEHLCDDSANEIDLVYDSDCEGRLQLGSLVWNLHYSYHNILDMTLWSLVGGYQLYGGIASRWKCKIVPKDCYYQTTWRHIAEDHNMLPKSFIYQLMHNRVALKEY
jgi:hypothetical protein